MVGRRADVTAVERPDRPTLQTGVEVDVRIEVGALADLDVLVAEHARLVDHLTASYQAVRLVQGKGAFDTLQQVRVIDGGHINTCALGTHVEGAGETRRLPHTLEQLIALYAFEVVQLRAFRLVAFFNLPMTFPTDETGPRRDETFITLKLKPRLLHEAEAVHMK